MDKKEYFYINSVGHIRCATFHSFIVDDYRLDIGNLFKTKQEAKHEVERRKVLAELKKYSSEFEYGKENYFMYYHNKYKMVLISCEEIAQRSELYFESNEKIKQAIENVGEERIIKYYLGVKD